MSEKKEKKNALTFTTETAWTKMDDAQRKDAFDLNERYKKFLDVGKTERTSALEIERILKENGFKPLKDFIDGKEKMVTGSKIYDMNREKGVVAYVIGQKPIKEGLKIVGAHIDVPRIDLKPNPVFEQDGLAFFKTHYYGGIKKYQWTSIPLALYGVLITKDNKKIDIAIGDDANDPIFMITDLLPHLAKDQAGKKLAEGIAGEELNVLAGNMPCDEDEKEKVKYQLLKLLNEKYGIVEEDFIAAELEIVPAGKAHDLGLDRSMVAAYGHDDRVCSYTGLEAIINVENPLHTACAMFVDKEEVGSQGNTGSHSRYYENTIAEILNIQEGSYNDLIHRRTMSNTKVLSGDVGAAYDPTFASAYEKRNSAFIGKGIQIVKYTGARGKGGCNDANAEFVGEVKNLFNDEEIVWQFGELGKVDQGGGGTIAYILANSDAEVIDCGVPVLSMHAPYEVVSKADVYMTYRGYKAFLER